MMWLTNLSTGHKKETRPIFERESLALGTDVLTDIIITINHIFDKIMDYYGTRTELYTIIEH